MNYSSLVTQIFNGLIKMITLRLKKLATEVAEKNVSSWCYGTLWAAETAYKSLWRSTLKTKEVLHCTIDSGSIPDFDIASGLPTLSTLAQDVEASLFSPIGLFFTQLNKNLSKNSRTKPEI